jgi:hypothetical protein
VSSISIVGLDKAEVLAALYNRARPQGMGFLHYDASNMTVREARLMLNVGDDHSDALRGVGVNRPTHYFDYLKGRVMKVNLGGDSFDSALYNRDNGPDEEAFGPDTEDHSIPGAVSFSLGLPRGEGLEEQLERAQAESANTLTRHISTASRR